MLLLLLLLVAAVVRLVFICYRWVGGSDFGGTPVFSGRHVCVSVVLWWRKNAEVLWFICVFFLISRKATKLSIRSCTKLQIV